MIGVGHQLDNATFFHHRVTDYGRNTFQFHSIGSLNGDIDPIESVATKKPLPMCFGPHERTVRVGRATLVKTHQRLELNVPPQANVVSARRRFHFLFIGTLQLQ
jgi:hypothetical protein